MDRPRGSDFREVRHRPWRDFDSVRRAATNAVAGLGFGVALARKDAADRSSRGDNKRFSEAFPGVPAAGEFDFGPNRAHVELTAAEATLAQMTIPFAMSLYNEYLVETVMLFERWKATGLTRAPESLTLGELGTHLQDAHGVALTGHQGELLELLAHSRNRVIHYGGRAGSHLLQLRRGLSGEAESAWERVAQRPFPDPVVGEPLVLNRRDAAAALAVVDHAASELNFTMRETFSVRFWADVAVEDYIEQFPRPWHSDDRAQREKAIGGYVARDYATVGISELDIAESVARYS